jgi:hypothetical protein
MTRHARRTFSILAATLLAALASGKAHAQSRVGADSARRLDRFGRDLLYGTAEGLAYAGLDQLRDQPVEWSRGWRGYGKRAASNVGEFVIQEGVTEGLAAAMNRPLDYAACACRGTPARFWWAVRGALLDQTAHGHESLAIPRIAGAYIGSAAQAAWRPENSDRVGVALLNGTTSLALGAVINLYHEFAPWSSGNRCGSSAGRNCARSVR